MSLLNSVKIIKKTGSLSKQFRKKDRAPKNDLFPLYVDNFKQFVTISRNTAVNYGTDEPQIIIKNAAYCSKFCTNVS